VKVNIAMTRVGNCSDFRYVGKSPSIGQLLKNRQSIRTARYATVRGCRRKSAIAGISASAGRVAVERRRCQIWDSGTRKMMNNAKMIAGITPTKKTPRQPTCG
jgi:hypothetical protein